MNRKKLIGRRNAYRASRDGPIREPSAPTRASFEANVDCSHFFRSIASGSFVNREKPIFATSGSVVPIPERTGSDRAVKMKAIHISFEKRTHGYRRFADRTATRRAVRVSATEMRET